jgi:hypothetical protein
MRGESRVQPTANPQGVKACDPIRSTTSLSMLLPATVGAAPMVP